MILHSYWLKLYLQDDHNCLYILYQIIIIFQTLKIEQMLTTGGGWQDQCGGLFPGVKLSESSKDYTQLSVSTKCLSQLITCPTFVVFLHIQFNLYVQYVISYVNNLD